MIRPFDKNDFDGYQEMSRDFYNSDATDHPVPEIYFRITFDEIISDSPLVKGWMLIDESQPASPRGYLLASITWSNEFGGRVSWLEELYIKAAYRGLGLGRKALETAMEELKNKNQVNGFRLEVAAGNTRASELYRRMGYTDVPYKQMWLTA